MSKGRVRDVSVLSGADYEEHRIILMVYAERLVRAELNRRGNLTGGWMREIQRCEKALLTGKSE